MFSHVPGYAGDPILSLIEDYAADLRPEKVNLSVGVYYDEDGQIPTLASIKRARQLIDQQPLPPDMYLPMEGLASFCDGLKEVLFDKSHPALQEERVAMIQTIGGSGALKVGADFLRRFFSESDVWVSDPTWDNHVALFGNAGFTVHCYPYLTADRKSLDFDAMLAAIEKVPSRGIVLLHPSCHNPTGMDLSRAQWDAVLNVAEKNDLILFFDSAYQGLGEGMEADAYAFRQAVGRRIPCLISHSFSKTFSLYGQRIGGLAIAVGDAQVAERVQGQLKATVRANYSSPPLYGARLVSTVLGNAELRALWLHEVENMRLRISEMRELLVDKIQQVMPSADFLFMKRQRGMFSYTGFSAEDVQVLRDEYGIYLVSSGRMCVAGLNHRNVHHVAAAFGALA